MVRATRAASSHHDGLPPEQLEQLAQQYRSARRPDVAIGLLQRAEQRYSDLHGRSDVRTLRARLERCNVNVDSGDTKGALVEYKRLVHDATRALGATHELTLEARGVHASVHFQRGECKKAVAIYKDLVADREQTLGRLDPSTSKARRNLGVGLIRIGKTEQGVAHWAAALADMECVMAADDPQLIDDRWELAGLLNHMGRHDDSAQLYQRQAEVLTTVRGGTDKETLRARFNQANALHGAGRYEEANIVDSALVIDLDAVFGADHEHSVAARDRLRLTRLQLGEVEIVDGSAGALRPGQIRVETPKPPPTDPAARSRYDEHVAALTALYSSPPPRSPRRRSGLSLEDMFATSLELVRGLGPDAHTTLKQRASCARQLADEGHQALAVHHFSLLVPDEARVWGPLHERTILSRQYLARCHLAAGQQATGVEVLRTLHAELTLVLGPNNLETLRGARHLANSLSNGGSYEEAIALLSPLPAALAVALGNDASEAVEASADLAAALWSDGQAAASATVARTTLPLADRVLGTDDERTLGLRIILGVAARAAGDIQGSIQLLQEAHRLQARKVGEKHPDTIFTAELIERTRVDGVPSR